MNDDECDRLRSLLRLSKEPGIPDGGQDAGVLILLDGTPDDYQVFLCIRSDEMRRHPGEVCFPGGMRDADENLQETAIREAEEMQNGFECQFRRRNKLLSNESHNRSLGGSPR
ncbi:hypothetical protein COOONC_04752 [Cooperia oncophora]